MNSQLTFAVAQSRQQDLMAAAQKSQSAAGLSTGSSIVRRLRDSALAMRLRHPASRPAHTDTPVTA